MQLPKTNKDDTRPKNAILLIYSFIHSNAYHLGMSKNHVYFNFPVLQMIPEVYLTILMKHCICCYIKINIFGILCYTLIKRYVLPLIDASDIDQFSIYENCPF